MCSDGCVIYRLRATKYTGSDERDDAGIACGTKMTEGVLDMTEIATGRVVVGAIPRPALSEQHAPGGQTGREQKTKKKGNEMKTQSHYINATGQVVLPECMQHTTIVAGTTIVDEYADMDARDADAIRDACDALGIKTEVDDEVYYNFDDMEKSDGGLNRSWLFKFSSHTGGTGGELFGTWETKDGTRRAFIGDGFIWGASHASVATIKENAPFDVETSNVSTHALGTKQTYIGSLPAKTVREAYELLEIRDNLGRDLPKIDGEDYGHWKARRKAAFEEYLKTYKSK